MPKQTYLLILGLCLCLIFRSHHLNGQEVPIESYSINTNGQVELELSSTPNDYFILQVRHDISSPFELASSVTMGQLGKTIISEPLAAYPIEHYKVLKYKINEPFDTDGDGQDDISEYTNIPTLGPLNAAFPINFEDGIQVIDSFTTYNKLSVTKDWVQWSEFLNGKRFTKYVIVDFDSSPKIYFINGNTHDLHVSFADKIGIDFIGEQVKKGQIIYHPTTISNNGTLGTFTFNYSNGKPQDFDVVQKCHELLAANMPFLRNNLSYFITDSNEEKYDQDKHLYDQSRIPILIEKDLFAEVDYWGLNQTEGYGYFREVSLSEIPGPKDIVLYESLPNALPRVGGIITSVLQTPLSHVNLRAIQDGVPNAFIRDPLLIDSIADLLGQYIYFKVEQEKYIIRKASLEEVNTWYDKLRPIEGQTPPLNLDYRTILPLDDIDFSMHDGFGAKCANVATMRTFGFPDGTIPDGFGIPFYYYQEFMKYNRFFEEVSRFLENPEFMADRNTRNDMLSAFRKKIRKADMPGWMLNDLASMHALFPEGTSVRCRSSTNNEDLPGFNGAGLYTSKTQHPHEGHISKSVKQVFASLWNLRAFDEREFYRINHFTASMAILCHPNFSDEKANGVGVSSDPMYQTQNTFYYLNSQIGEDLITNPDTASIPEEILLNKVATSEDDHIIIQYSNLVPDNTQIMEGHYLDEIREYLTVIHNEFEKRYDAAGNESFAMEIEYKITKNDELLIKQARPWVTYIPDGQDISNPPIVNKIKIYPNPAQAYLNVEWDDVNISTFLISNMNGQIISVKALKEDTFQKSQIYIWKLPAGLYFITALDEFDQPYSSKTFIKK